MSRTLINLQPSALARDCKTHQKAAPPAPEGASQWRSALHSCAPMALMPPQTGESACMHAACSPALGSARVSCIMCCRTVLGYCHGLLCKYHAKPAYAPHRLCKLTIRYDLSDRIHAATLWALLLICMACVELRLFELGLLYICSAVQSAIGPDWLSAGEGWELLLQICYKEICSWWSCQTI